MRRKVTFLVSTAFILALIACVPRDTSDTRRDESVLIIPVPAPGLSVRAERKVWNVLPGTHSAIDGQMSLLLKRRDGIGDVFVSSPPMTSIGTSMYEYRSYIVGLGNMSASEINTDDNGVRKMSSFRFEEWRDNVLCITQIAIITFVGQFPEKVLFRGSWQKDDIAAAKAVKEVLKSIAPQ